MDLPLPLLQTLRAVGFLSRIPVPNSVFPSDKMHPASADLAYYPLAGLVIALPAALMVAIAAAIGLSSFLVAALATTTLVLTIGALHEDGLADCADGFGGGHTIERRLEIMKDSHIGAYGTLALIASFALRAGALTAVFNTGGAIATIFAVFACAAVSRGAIAYIWTSLANARQGGTADTAGVPTESSALAAIIGGLVCFVILGTLANGFIPAALGATFAVSVAIGFTALSKRMIGGYTGDTLGAQQQLTEIAALLGLAITIGLPN